MFTPAPPSSVLSPAPPATVSLPTPAVILLLALSPTLLNHANEEPITFTNPVNVSVPRALVALAANKFTRTDEVKPS